jgi:hypothetical protein
MSTTRHAENESPLRQERYASDPAFGDHLKASAVARKCSLMMDPEHREICLYLQYASMQSGGLPALVDDFLKRYGDRVGSRTVRKNAGSVLFSAATVRAVREELNCHDEFLLQGETSLLYEFFSSSDGNETHKINSLRLPNEYPAAAFFDWCGCRAADDLENWLRDLCLNPATSLDNPPSWFCDLERSLLDYIADRRTDGLFGKIVTSIGSQINDALDYAWDERCMVLINGVSRMGKTFQVQQWCRTYPGRVRYVQVPSGNDDISFFRAVARALGTASGSAMKTTQIKRQIEDAIQDSGIMIVLDEAHYLFPQYKDVRMSPRRINWVLTELVNKGIPVALIVTPQFDIYQKSAAGSGWASEQLDGRISYRLDLPATLPEADLAAIIKFNLPEADQQVVEGLCAYAKASGKFIAGIEAVAKRARFLAKKAGRLAPNKTDLIVAMKEVDPAIVNMKPIEEDKAAVCTQTAKVRKGTFRGVAQAVQLSENGLVAVP